MISVKSRFKRFAEFEVYTEPAEGLLRTLKYFQ